MNGFILPDNTSTVHMGLLSEPCETLHNTNDLNNHTDYNSQQHSEIYQKEEDPCSFPPNRVVPSPIEHSFLYSNHMQPQQEYYYQLASHSTPMQHTPVDVRSTTQPTYYSYQHQQPYFQPSSYTTNVSNTNSYRLRHNDASKTEKEMMTVSPIINIQDLTGYTGQFV